MTIARGQMKRQLYAEGGIKSLMDIIASNPDKFADILNILENVPRGDYMKTGPKMTPRYKLMPRENKLNEMTEEEVMEMLRQKQMRPEYQYDEENPYMGPRSMRMGGGMMDTDQARKMLQDIAPPGEFLAYINPDEASMLKYMGGAGIDINQSGIPSFFIKSIAKAVTGAVKGVGDAIGKVATKENLDKIAQVASFIPGPHQPFAAAYTGARGSGIGGSDFGGFQIGGFTPSGGFGGFGGGSSPFTSPFQSGAGQAPGIFSGGNLNLGDIGRLANMARQVSDTGDYESTILNESIYGQTDGIFGPMGRGQQKQTGGGINDILGKVIQGGLSAYAGKKSYDDQKRINEAQQREYDNYMKKREEKMRQYTTGEGLQSMDVKNRFREKADVVARPGVMGGGMMDLDIRTNPQGVKEIDYRKKGGFVPPIGIKEKADDIPAMLSNNEFVFTADAVRGAGKGNVNEGAKKMYTLMKKLEAGGKA